MKHHNNHLQWNEREYPPPPKKKDTKDFKLHHFEYFNILQVLSLSQIDHALLITRVTEQPV